MPHLQRMAVIAQHIQGADVLVHSAYEVLNGIQQAILLINDAGRLVHANSSGEALLRAGDGLTMRGRYLTAGTGATTRRLEAILKAAGSNHGMSGTLRLPRSPGKPALSLVAMPIRGLNDFQLNTQPTILVCISDPLLHPSAQPAMLQALFGLTSAEAGLAGDLLEGRGIKDIALSSGRSVNTVRNLLARLMAKTETNRQADLIRQLERVSHISPERGIASKAALTSTKKSPHSANAS
jgi:DNA-binding CsgD family transcriptional regulator